MKLSECCGFKVKDYPRKPKCRKCGKFCKVYSEEPEYEDKRIRGIELTREEIMELHM